MTDKQSLVLGYIRRFIAQHGYPPTRAEIARNFGWYSPNAAHEYLKALEKQGVIAIRRKLSRGIQVLEQAS